MRQILKKYAQFWEVSLIIILLVTAITFFVSISLPAAYRSEAKVLVVQKQVSLDLFNAAEASRYVITILSEVLYTDQFVTEIIKNDVTLSSALPQDLKERNKVWEKQLGLSTKEGAGIMFLTFTADDPALAQRFMQGIVNTLLTVAPQYHGRGEEIELSVINNPTLESDPVSPRVFINTLVGLIASLILVGILFYLEDIYDVQFFRWSKKTTGGFLSQGTVARATTAEESTGTAKLPEVLTTQEEQYTAADAGVSDSDATNFSNNKQIDESEMDLANKPVEPEKTDLKVAETAAEQKAIEDWLKSGPQK